MQGINNPLELYKLLKKNNCRECTLPSCMAFAAAVFQGQKTLADCPYVDKKLAGSICPKVGKSLRFEERQQDKLVKLKNEVAGIDLAELRRSTQVRGKYT